eukprot:SAG31_NODE_745_length_12408_cov_4.755057_2_plen_200_part_00
MAAERPGNGNDASIRVVVDDVVVLEGTHPSALFEPLTAGFVASGSSARIRFENLSPHSLYWSSTFFIDAVAVVPCENEGQCPSICCVGGAAVHCAALGTCGHNCAHTYAPSTCVPPSGCHELRCGRGRGRCTETSRCADDLELNEVGCCADTAVAGFQRVKPDTCVGRHTRRCSLYLLTPAIFCYVSQQVQRVGRARPR